MSDNNAVTQLPTAKPDPEIVERLEELLEGAKAGRVRALIIAHSLAGSSHFLIGVAGSFAIAEANFALDLMKLRLIREAMSPENE